GGRWGGMPSGRPDLVWASSVGASMLVIGCLLGWGHSLLGLDAAAGLIARTRRSGGPHLPLAWSAVHWLAQTPRPTSWVISMPANVGQSQQAGREQVHRLSRLTVRRHRLAYRSGASRGVIHTVHLPRYRPARGRSSASAGLQSGLQFAAVQLSALTCAHLA